MDAQISKIAESNLLFRTRVRMMGDRIVDARISREAETSRNMARGTVNAHKKRWKSDHYDAMKRSKGRITDIVNHYTSPWEDGGLKLLPNVNVFACRSEIDAEIDEFNKSLDGFCEYFESGHLLRDAEGALGGAFNRRNYPSSALELRAGFGVMYEWDRIPPVDKHVLLAFEDDLNEEVQAFMEEFQSSAEQRILSRAHAATETCWRRLYEAIQKVAHTLQPDSRIFDAHIDTLADLLDVLPSLNLLNDPDMAKMADEARKVILNPLLAGNVDIEFDVDMWRRDEAIRADTAGKVDTLLRKVAAFVPADAPSEDEEEVDADKQAQAA